VSFAAPLANGQVEAQTNIAKGTEIPAAVRAMELTDPETIRQRGITPEQIKGLHERFSLSNREIERVPESTLQIMLWQLRHPKVDLHAAAIRFRLLQLRDEHGQIPTNAWLKAAQQRAQVISGSRPGAVNYLFPAGQKSGGSGSFITPNVAGIQSSGWTWLGPGNIGGRVRAILVHPTTNSIMWAGGVDGGVWKTTNSGASWFPLDDFMANLAISCMVMDPANPNIIYVGTGEGMYNFDAVQGAGIFKTTDGGATWAQLSSTATSSFFYVNRLAICPTNSLILLAATRSGIFRSVDGGTNWSSASGTETLDIQFNPAGGQCIASGWNGNAFYSMDAGVTWSAATGLPQPSGFVVGRVELAYAPSNPLIVYASEDNNSGEVYQSTDGGQTYSLVNTGNNYLGGQGWYDNCVWVDPTNPNTVVVGGLDLWRSTDGGSTLTDIGGYSGSIHPDNHAIVNISGYNGTSVRTVFIGNDGGIFKATDIYNASSGSGWTDLNNNLGITQFYGAAGNATSGTIVAGAQDNGSDRYTTGGGPNGWSIMFGGDGGFCASDSTDPNYFYGEYTYLQIYRSTDGGASAGYITSGLSDAGGAEDYDPGGTNDSSANFIAPFILDPNNPNTLLAGGMSLWRSTNAKAGTPTWTAINAGIGTPVSAIAVAPGNSDIIWVGYDDGSVYFTTNGTTGSPAWYQANLGTPNLPARYCTRITIDPNNSSTVYATFGGFSSGNVWRTIDNGTHWTDISGGLPDAPVNSLVIKPSDSSSLYVGTEVGVFASADGGATWSTSNDGPANVDVDELFWMGDTLVAVTHGRGCYSIAIPSDTLFVTPGTGFNASGFAGGPFSPTTGSLTLTNVGASSLPWSLVNTSAWLNVSPGSGTLAAGARSTVIASLNAAANTLAVGSYSASVLFTNQTTHATQTRLFTLTVESPELIQNGGFETGDFTGWTVVNNDGYTYVDNGSQMIPPHSGSYLAVLGQASSDGLCTISQTLTTSPGQPYLLSLWLDSTNVNGGIPNEFSVAWNGSVLFDQVNIGSTGWTNLQFIVTATNSSTVLQFGEYNDAWYFGLDDVSVLPIPPTVSQAVSVTNHQFQLSWNAVTGLVYQVQYKTNLLSTNWLNLGSPITATNSALTTTDATGPDPQRFYRIMMSP
jgi:photosystem II stability/assembly factor-like uncharacterized protein